jgi:hypothetical protein
MGRRGGRNLQRHLHHVPAELVLGQRGAEGQQRTQHPQLRTGIRRAGQQVLHGEVAEGVAGEPLQG